VKLLGDPYNTGIEGGMSTLTWAYATLSKGEKLQVALDSNDRIVDIALNPSEGYKNTNQCTQAAAPPQPAPAAIADPEPSE